MAADAVDDTTEKAEEKEEEATEKDWNIALINKGTFILVKICMLLITWLVLDKGDKDEDDDDEKDENEARWWKCKEAGHVVVLMRCRKC